MNGYARFILLSCHLFTLSPVTATREQPVIPPKETIRCSVGVTAYNEEENIGPLMQALLDQHVHQAEIVEIIVVASACTDRTVPIVQEYAALDPRVKIIEQERREGKTSAINLFLAAATTDICVLESGDTLPDEYAVEHLVRMFADPEVGMVGAQKVAVNTPDHIAGLLSHIRLRMEHTLCLEIPRLGEMIAFRKVFDRIPPDVAMDEAFVEAIVVERGMRVQYAPDAIVYNTGPDTIKDFVKQRRRNHAGHLYLKHKYGYAVSSIQNRRVLKIAFKEVWGGRAVPLDILLAGRVGKLEPPAGLVRLCRQTRPPCGVGYGLEPKAECAGREGAQRRKGRERAVGARGQRQKLGGCGAGCVTEAAVSTGKTLDIPSELYDRIERLATTREQSVAYVLEEALALVEDQPVELARSSAMSREEAAYRLMHEELFEKYAGQYVAVHNGKLVDVDSDELALAARINVRFPNEIILLKQVQQSPMREINYRSVRIIRER
jgi:biofilm PGA synthesis N-glycosyltransferase PgaC